MFVKFTNDGEIVSESNIIVGENVKGELEISVVGETDGETDGETEVGVSDELLVGETDGDKEGETDGCRNDGWRVLSYSETVGASVSVAFSILQRWPYNRNVHGYNLTYTPRRKSFGSRMG